MLVYLVGIEREFDIITVDEAVGIAKDHNDIISIDEYLKIDDEIKKYYIAIIS